MYWILVRQQKLYSLLQENVSFNGRVMRTFLLSQMEKFAVLVLTTRYFVKYRLKIKDEVCQENQIQIQSTIF